MKKIIILAVAALAVSSAASGQMAESTKAMLEKQIVKSDTDLKNPKRNGRPSFWMARGKLMYDAYIAPDNGVYHNMGRDFVEEKFGKGKEEGVVNVGTLTNVEKVTYPAFNVYYQTEGTTQRVALWEATDHVEGASLDAAVEAYAKAFELSEGGASKDEVTKILKKDIQGRYMMTAKNKQVLGEFTKSADALLAAYKITAMPAVDSANYNTLYLAGYLYTFGGDYENGARYLSEAAAHGEEENGETYYNIALSYDKLDRKADAQKALETGAAKFPENARLVELLANIYAASEDPEQHLEFVESAAARFNKPDLWNSVGSIYDKRGETDKAMDAFGKALELRPDDAVANFNTGIMNVKKGVVITDEVNKATFSNQIEYDKAFEAGLDYFYKALPYLEKAVEIKPDQVSYVTYIRDFLVYIKDNKPEYRAKYDKYVQMARDMGAAPGAAE